LTKAVEALLRDAAEAVFVSRASLWEVAIKISMGRLRMDIVRFASNVEQHGFEWLEIKNEHLIAVATLPTFEDHRDPFDRLLVAQSQREPLTLVTADSRLARYGSTVQVV
jgi:PIN domain nuclease of toxin-antitoxin system